MWFASSTVILAGGRGVAYQNGQCVANCPP